MNATHKGFGLEAPVAAWRALGYQTHTDGSLYFMASGFDREDDRSQAILAAIAMHGMGDPIKIIGHACAEVQRREEERARIRAQMAEAESIAKLAASIQEAGQDRALDAIMGRLSERTQFAVRQQLKRG